MPELRKDPIVDRWVIIAQERGKRPADFASPTVNSQAGFCPFCLGNEGKTPQEILALRPNGSGPNESGWSLRVVPNKYPALTIEGGIDRVGEGMYDKMNGIGAHEVIIEGPCHEVALEELPERAVQETLWAFQQRIIDLKRDPRFRYILVFKNHGEAAGATLEHTHSQLVALPIVPELVLEELDGARRHYEYKERCIYCDIIAQERGDGRRVVMENHDFIAVCPYAPRFPFETWILPKYHSAHFEHDSTEALAGAANILKDVLLKLRMVCNQPPYNFVLHNSTVQSQHSTYFHWHIEIMPKLTKLAGFEAGTGFHINPVSPEEAADILRSCTVHP
ncbi:galactose-1-phosphate uridylyltransferase [Nitrospina sp. 32_T5]|uniref:galactose-1-phosphate uridylyltransferase n=1 Tax=unclassified Nitrospina TaxID=2638683 RepID=UPI003F9D8DAB